MRTPISLAEKTKMEAARTLIQEKRYSEARALLQGVNHPTAKEWVKRIDAISPKKTSRRGWIFAFGFIGILLVAITLMSVLILTRENNKNIANQATNIMSTQAASGTAYIESLILTATASCTPREWWNSIEELVAEFFDTTEVATQTARASLSSVQLELRRIYREFDRTEYPACIAGIYFDLRSGMDAVNEALGNFAAQNDFLIDIQFRRANENFYSASLQLREAGILVSDYRVQAPWIVLGGDPITEPTATALVNELATFSVELEVTLNAMRTATAIPNS